MNAVEQIVGRERRKRLSQLAWCGEGLALSEKESEVMIEAQSYIDWREKAEEILKFRGPKW